MSDNKCKDGAFLMVKASAIAPHIAGRNLGASGDDIQVIGKYFSHESRITDGNVRATMWITIE